MRYKDNWPLLFLLIAVIYNYMLPIILYDFSVRLFSYLSLFLITTIIIFKNFNFKFSHLNFSLGNKPINFLYLIIIISFLGYKNYHLWRSIAPITMLLVLSKNRILNLLSIIGVILLSVGYSKVYFLLFPLFYWFLIEKKILKIILLIPILFFFGGFIVFKFQNVANLSELPGFDTLWLSEYIFDTYPSKKNFLYGESLKGVILNFIPRTLWEGKPIAFGVQLSMDIWGQSIDNIFTNYGPGIVGESYANFGKFGPIIFGIITGYILKVMKNITERLTFFPTIYFLPFIVYYIRGDFLNGCINILIQILILSLININAKHIKSIFRL